MSVVMVKTFIDLMLLKKIEYISLSCKSHSVSLSAKAYIFLWLESSRIL